MSISASASLKLEHLLAEGFAGNDSSLSVSLIEYGLAWKEDGEYLTFYYAHPSVQGRFGHANERKDLDPKREWSWVDWERVATSHGLSVAELLALPLPGIVTALLSQYGAENVFGASHAEGFEIDFGSLPPEKKSARLRRAARLPADRIFPA
jgi:hypothetical protein